MSNRDVTALFVIAVIIGLIAFPIFHRRWLQLRRAEFIRTYAWPRGLLERLEKHRPGMARKDSALVSRSLRQFFIAYLMSGKRYVSMPSQAADDLWHEFILYTREYERFCRQAFGGFLHHSPAVVMGSQAIADQGLRRVWWQCCKEENINPRKATRLPLLFALDAKLKIADGFNYVVNCDAVRRQGAQDGRTGATYCGGDLCPIGASGCGGLGCSTGGFFGGDGGGS